MTEYKAYVIIDGKPKWIIKNENGDIINRSPTDKELKNALVKSSRKKICSNEELLNYLRVFHKENGRLPIAKEFLNNPDYPTFVTYQKRFGSWNKAITLAGLDNREKCARSNKYSDEELLIFLTIFYEENGKVPGKRDFINNFAYPDYQNYTAHFGSWGNALKMVGLDVDTMVKQGNLKTEKQKGRWVEIIVRDNFENESIDLSGNNPSSMIDGICPNGQTYEVKSSPLRVIGKWSGWTYGTGNKDKDDDIEAIQWYYFAAFNEDYTELYHMWRVPGEIVEKNTLHIGMYGGEFNIENMAEYDITDKFKDAMSKNKK